ncbi:hypothetical protein NGRA_1583 [Nosema granulosis]|uniref:Rho-GAP domain-containing protein n=1 Tax=Nosema granulosis TaxID=83296 RepID=A0A9P6GZ85_9MICR|nr:hypothetical protein NGRA_1583 [Nosema granulosis]
MENETIYYDTLRETEVEILKKECLRVIRMEPKDNICDNFFNDLCSIFSCCCGVCDTSSPGITEDVIKVTEILKNNDTIPKLFYQEILKEDLEEISEAMSYGYGLPYEKVDPLILAAALKTFCRDHLDYYLPKDIHLLLLYSYRDNEKERKEAILRRVPFIMSEHYRLFFIQMFRLFRGIDKEYESSKVNLEDMLDMFSTLLIKEPEGSATFNGYTKKLILKDLMDTDFTKVPKEFF